MLEMYIVEPTLFLAKHFCHLVHNLGECEDDDFVFGLYLGVASGQYALVSTNDASDGRPLG